VKDAKGLSLEIVEKIKRMIKSSTELKGLEISAEELVTMSENVANGMYSDITGFLSQGDYHMVLSLFTPNIPS
jgi:ATP sulfurylase